MAAGLPSHGDYVLPFGKYRNKKICDIAKSNDGLLWLDWAADNVEGFFGDAIRRYIANDQLAEAIENAKWQRDDMWDSLEDDSWEHWKE